MALVAKQQRYHYLSLEFRTSPPAPLPPAPVSVESVVGVMPTLRKERGLFQTRWAEWQSDSESIQWRATLGTGRIITRRSTLAPRY